MSGEASCFPLQTGSPENLEQVRRVLREFGFDEPGLCRLLGIPVLSALGKIRWAELDSSALPGPLRHCMGLFLFGQQFPRADLERSLGPAALEPFLALGLLRTHSRDSGSIYAPVFLYPARGFLIASDRHDDPEAVSPTTLDARPDVVFPAIFGGTLRFLELLPSAEGGDALDLCGGSGIGALCLSRTARVAVSADVTERSTRYAEFNARLNGCAALEALCGDVYEPVAGRLFDCITAHPPYVPALGDRMIYRDAGPGGEDITQAVVAGLPQHLRPGGKALILCQGRDAEDGSFELRARNWLGTAQGDFDVVFALQDTKTLEAEVAGLANRTHRPTPGELSALRDRFRRMGTRQFVYGALALQRHKAPATAPWTGRVRLSPETTGDDFARLIDWHHRGEQPGFCDWLSGASLQMSPALQLTVRHVVHEQALLPAEFVFETSRPFASATRFDGWVAPLVARFNGRRTPADIYAEARQENEMPADFAMGNFLDLVSLLVAKGYLAIADGVRPAA
jgi:methylase of polypeptide subunit release factors